MRSNSYTFDWQQLRDGGSEWKVKMGIGAKLGVKEKERKKRKEMKVEVGLLLVNENFGEDGGSEWRWKKRMGEKNK